MEIDSLIHLALAPVFIIALYIYFHDKYEKEPKKILWMCIALGVVIVPAVLAVDKVIIAIWHNLGLPIEGLWSVAFNAFIVAALVEESLKYLPLLLLVWKLPSFDERYDGIVYATYISLGFAAVENFLYVLGSDNAVSTGIMRSLLSVPAHAIFGITMGYYFGLAKFIPKQRNKYLLLSLLIPVILHGVYDFLLMAKIPILLLLFVPYMVWLYYNGRKLMSEHIKNSEFAV